MRSGYGRQVWRWVEKVLIVIGLTHWGAEASADCPVEDPTPVGEGLCLVADEIVASVDAWPGSMERVSFHYRDEGPELLKGRPYTLHMALPNSTPRGIYLKEYPRDYQEEAESARCRRALAIQPRVTDNGIRYDGIACIYYAEESSGTLTIEWEIRRRNHPLATVIRGQARLSSNDIVERPQSRRMRHSIPLVASGTGLTLGGGAISAYTLIRYSQDSADIWADGVRNYDDPWLALNDLAGGITLLGVGALVVDGLLYRRGSPLPVTTVISAGGGSTALAATVAF